ncbi:MAG TPA: pitrilysin family protein [Planctomycetota bacterium]|nr:pitrilysin family protein [Planctomycetota bacterium]
MITSNESITISNGVNLHLFQTDAFKTTTIKAFIHLPLDKNATANALLVRTMARGCQKYPTMRKISVFLDSLYGAIFGADISKIGERHIIELYFEFISRRFLPKNVDNTRYALNFLRQIIFNPLLPNGSFRPDYFSQEQAKLKDLIKSVYDDKGSYADERCIQEMCPDEPYRIYEYGEIKRVDKLSPEEVLNHYRNIVLKSPIDIFICGPSGIDRIKRTVADIFKPRLRKSKLQTPVIPATIINKEITKERLVREKEQIDQAKLVMGYRTYTSWEDKNIFGLMMASGILGGFPHSKLFRYVREKAGLAYYASSMLEKSKGLMFIRAGINHDKFDDALKIIKEQVLAIQSGDITESEINDTRSGILNRLRAIEDSASSFIDYNLELSINNRHDSLKELKEQFMAVKKEDIVRAIQKLKLDTVYFLTK